MDTNIDFAVFADFDEFRSKHPKLAKKLVDEVGEDYWMSAPLTLYKSKVDFAKYEVNFGWYYDIFNNIEDKLNGAPNPLDCIDYNKLGDMFVDTMDESVNCLVGSYIITTSYGFY